MRFYVPVKRVSKEKSAKVGRTVKDEINSLQDESTALLSQEGTLRVSTELLVLTAFYCP